MERLVEDLCSKECAGRAPGTPGGARARTLVLEALRGAGLDPFEQRVGRSPAVNLVAKIPGDVDRWVLVGAHFDHLGARGQAFYPGADDNAAAVAILVEVARGLQRLRAAGRGVIIAAFDAEEPPWFLTGEMGSAWFAAHCERDFGVPLDRIDLMVCMDLVGHALGFEGLPADVRSSIFALGAERSLGTPELVDELARAETGVIVRRADAEIIPPLSDYDTFWKRGVPFLFLTGGRSSRYHTPEDTPEHLDFAKVRATARWLERFTRATCARPEDHVQFARDRRDDASTLRSFLELVSPLAAVSPEAQRGVLAANELALALDRDGRLPDALADGPRDLVAALESALA